MTLKDIKDKKSLLEYLESAAEKDEKLLAEIETVVAFSKAKAKIKASMKDGVAAIGINSQLSKIIKFDGGRDFLETLIRSKFAAKYKEQVLMYLSKH